MMHFYSAPVMHFLSAVDKAQIRLCGRYRKLMAKGKRPTVITTAIAREMSAFLWDIGQHVAPRAAM